MTKRFINHDDIILDKYGEQLVSTDEIADKMNELHEERNYFKRKKCEYFNNWNNAHLDNINLRQENQELKELVKSLQKELNNCEEDWVYEEGIL